jgi:hypothetical protein
MKNCHDISIIFMLSIALTACGGGGGGGGGTVASANSFDIKAGYAALAASGFSKTFNITGDCVGQYTITRAAASTPATFEGITGFSGNQSDSYSWTGCNPPSGSSTETRYYDSNYVPLGSSVVGGNYSVYAATPNIPTAAKVGDVVIVGTLNKYTNSTKATSAGRVDYTLVIEPDTATTAIANTIGKTYTSTGALTSTEQNRYRVGSDNSLTPISLEVQYANPPSNTHIFGN